MYAILQFLGADKAVNAFTTFFYIRSNVIRLEILIISLTDESLCLKIDSVSFSTVREVLKSGPAKMVADKDAIYMIDKTRHCIVALANYGKLNIN